MAKGNGIIVSPEPRGIFWEGTISGTPKPGTIMQIQAGTDADDNGRFTFEVYNVAADGNQRPMFVLLPDWGQGKLATDAYVTGSHGYLYVPVAGEELNMLVANIAGTGDDFDVGSLFMVDDGTGKLIITTGSPESEPFMCLEDVAALTADTLVWCLFTGY